MIFFAGIGFVSAAREVVTGFFVALLTGSAELAAFAIGGGEAVAGGVTVGDTVLDSAAFEVFLVAALGSTGLRLE